MLLFPMNGTIFIRFFCGLNSCIPVCKLGLSMKIPVTISLYFIIFC